MKLVLPIEEMTKEIAAAGRVSALHRRRRVARWDRSDRSGPLRHPARPDTARGRRVGDHHDRCDGADAGDGRYRRSTVPVRGRAPLRFRRLWPLASGTPSRAISPDGAAPGQRALTRGTVSRTGRPRRAHPAPPEPRRVAATDQCNAQATTAPGRVLRAQLVVVVGLGRTAQDRQHGPQGSGRVLRRRGSAPSPADPRPAT